MGAVGESSSVLACPTLASAVHLQSDSGLLSLASAVTSFPVTFRKTELDLSCFLPPTVLLCAECPCSPFPPLVTSQGTKPEEEAEESQNAKHLPPWPLAPNPSTVWGEELVAKEGGDDKQHMGRPQEVMTSMVL